MDKSQLVIYDGYIDYQQKPAALLLLFLLSTGPKSKVYTRGLAS